VGYNGLFSCMNKFFFLFIKIKRSIISFDLVIPYDIDYIVVNEEIILYYMCEINHPFGHIMDYFKKY